MNSPSRSTSDILRHFESDRQPNRIKETAHDHPSTAMRRREPSRSVGFELPLHDPIAHVPRARPHPDHTGMRELAKRPDFDSGAGAEASWGFESLSPCQSFLSPRAFRRPPPVCRCSSARESRGIIILVSAVRIRPSVPPCFHSFFWFAWVAQWKSARLWNGRSPARNRPQVPLLYFLPKSVSECSAARLAHLSGRQGVVGSNPAIPTILIPVGSGRNWSW